ncbi:flagellar hook-associated protein FlgK [Maridesulfovibrio salexigens]|uniref:Flagellar hook-associated protein 1 n=1 Tax=Maridesulfovibrio salexigens (strain ATCC 14822 / DSM 2638 / NCIMB 8403 / VKM B-1763) TaxID=526222 RepID=C6BZV0_MARSD|nr:flagellar hook-associated protein FlgK [Maridesulfovibrio salexigens]ACS79007.1 flagellar hook-associated protein FlgK [Maridesulfovibrio salexigens DSM 2638]
MSLTNTLSIGQRALANAQVSINTTSNNIANSETEGYQRADAVYDSLGNINSYGNSLGTGADIVAIRANWDRFIEKQFLIALGSLSCSEAQLGYLSQMDSVFNQSEEQGLAAAQDEFLSAWNGLSTYPDSLAEREDLLGEAESLLYGLNSSYSELRDMSASVESEIVDQVNTANELIDSIGLLNEQISANPDNYELVASRDQAIRELDELIGVEVLSYEDGSTKIYTETGHPLVEGEETHHLAVAYDDDTSKTGLFWENGSGGLVDITPMSDESGDAVSGRITGGSIAGLFITRDEHIQPTLDRLDEYAAALIWETNRAHSQGAGLEPHTAVEGTYGVEDQTAALSDSGLDFEDRITSGEFTIHTYDADGNPEASITISIDPSTDSLDDIVSNINASLGGSLTASVNADGELAIEAVGDSSFEFGEDSSGFLAAAGINTFFEGSSAGDIAVNNYVASNPSHLNAGEVGSDGTVASGSNSTAQSINDLLSRDVSIGEGANATSATLTEYLSAIVSDVGAAASTMETRVTCDTAAAQIYAEQQESVSGVNVDEELVNLTRHQQQYEAACQIISVTRDMIDTVLGIV